VYDKIIKFGLFFLILFAPLAFGSVYVWAYSIMELAIFSMLIAMVLKKTLIEKRKVSFPLFFPVLVFLGLVLFQMMPLPPSAIRFLSPTGYELYCQTLDGYPNGRGTIGPETNEERTRETIGQGLEVKSETLESSNTHGFFENWRTLSIHPHASLTELLKIMSYLGIFLVIVNFVDSKRKLVQISTTIAFCGVIVALLAIAQKVGQAPKIYWFWEPVFKKDGSFFGPFVNPNHFAGYMEMVIPVAIGLFIWQWRNLLRSQAKGFREFLINIGSEKGCKLILFSFLIVLMVGVLFLSRSRGGVASFLGSMIFLLFMVNKREKGRRSLLILLGLLICIFSFLIWMGIRPLLEEFSTIRDVSGDYDVQYRFQNWKDATNMFRGFPVFGAGLGTFASIFPKYKTSSLQYYYLFLENDYLQLVCEMGIAGFGIFLWFAMSFVRVIQLGDSKYRSGKISSVQYISLYGCLPSIIAIMIHSFWDFNIHIPSNATLLSMLLALSLAGARIGLKEHYEYT
jgi:O-antigen ligase